jgi:glycerol-3-phosphate acyltransferase PlsY
MPDPAVTLAFAAPTPLEALAVLVAYLVGAIPFGWVVAKLAKGVDIRTIGSGNIGATNAMRAVGRPLGLVAFALDLGKAYAPVAWLAPALARGADAELALGVACGGAAVCGHVWPVYLRFKGGKAVATGCGAVAALDPLVFLSGGVVWLAALGITRFVGLASILMCAAFPVAAAARWSDGAYPHGGGALVVGLVLLALLVVVRHRANIRRMWAGTEPRAFAGGAKGTHV